MSFDYEHNTRKFYQDDATAQRYHEMFMSPNGWRNLPSRIVARRERHAIETLLKQAPHRTVLDLPAGTGKLAGIFASLGSRVAASDISASMLKLAEIEYARAGCVDATFQVEDATKLRHFSNRQFEVVVCLRLMHRVPASLRKIMLSEFARVGQYVIVSFGIENGFHKARRSMRAAVFGGSRDTLCFCSLAQACTELEPMFQIVKRIWIAPALSQETIFLLRSRQSPEGARHCPNVPGAES